MITQAERGHEKHGAPCRECGADYPWACECPPPDLCILCDEPYTDEHKETCPDWPKEDRHG
jgi:hypothetical protein